MSDALSIADALTHAAREMGSAASITEALDLIVQVAERSLDGIDHVGISLAHRDGRIETMAGTDPLVWELDSIQYELREGPCVYSITDDPVVLAENFRHEQRWPRFVPEGARRGLRSQLALRLFLADDTLGGLNMYSTSSDTLSQEVVHTAELFAAHAALALGRVREIDQLGQGMQSRKIIGQAVGIVMQRFGLTEDRAFAFLARASSHSNIKLRDVAAALVEELEARNSRKGGGGGPVPSPGGPRQRLV